MVSLCTYSCITYLFLFFEIHLLGTLYEKCSDCFVILFVVATRPWGRVLAWSCSVADQRGSFILSARASTLGYMAAVIVENWKQLCIVPKSFNRWPLDYENEVLCFTYCFQNMPRGFLSSKPWEFSRYLNPFQRYTSSFLISFFFFWFV